MIVKDYIKQKFQTFGIHLSEADLCDMYLNTGISGDDELEAGNHTSVSVAITRFIPSLLLRATNVSESGFSMSWDIKGLKEYYAYLCKRYGIEDVLNQKPKLTFL